MSSGDDANVHARATLPPPEWGPNKPDEPAAVPASDQRDGDPLARRTERRAEEASLRVALERAASKGDVASERAACVSLARMLAGQERSLDDAVSTAARALALGEDEELRGELCGWLEAMGRHAEGARVLVSSPNPSPALLARAGVLFARAGEAAEAKAALILAAERDAEDALSLELLAALSGWAPEEVDAREASTHYLAAAARRAESGALAGELEDCTRAFEADPTNEAAARALAAAFEARGKGPAAAEVIRAHAASLDATKARALFVAELDAAGSDVLRALEAAFDGRLDMEFSGRGSGALDDLLLRAGLFELLSARLEIRAERAPPAERVGVYEQLARLAAGPLADPARAALEHVRILAEDPSREQVVSALGDYAASTRDDVPLVEGLVRGSTSPSGTSAGRAACARVLAQIAEERLGQPRLARWAYEQLLGAEPSDASAASAARRLAAEVDAQEYGTWLRTLEQQLGRDTRSFGLGRWVLGRELLSPEEIDARAAVAAAARARGNATEANETTLPLLEKENASPRAISLAWVNATLAKDEIGRARAMRRLAAFAAPDTQALLCAVAADALASAGDRAAAREAATAACREAPNATRSVASLARACVGSLDRTAASAIERGIQATFATGPWCLALADALAALGERHYAVAWSQRLVALRPGDVKALERLVTRAIESDDPQRLADVLAWVTPQSYPTAVAAPVIGHALAALAKLDAARATVVARRALDAFGASDPVLQPAVLDVAERVQEPALAAAALERHLAAASMSDEERATLGLGIARLRRQLGDADAEARILRGVLRSGVAPIELEGRVAELLGQSLSGDGELAWLELRARVLDAKLKAQTSRHQSASRGLRAGPVSRRAEEQADDGIAALRLATVKAWRELGAALWDMVGDRRAALEAWTAGARLWPGGFARLALDVTRFAEPSVAVAMLTDLAASVPDVPSAARIAAQAARAALAAGEPARALELARDALTRDAALTEALELAERGALGAGRAREMTKVYELVSAAARGRFGRRAAHYRGARFFEQRGDLALALKHAAQAFAAVPSEGATLLLLARTAERAGDPAAAVVTIEEVAAGATSPGIRAAWLLRAASLAGTGEEGARRRVDLLLRASLLTPTVSVITMLGEAGRELLRHAPEERDPLQIRFGRAARNLTQRLDGPDGARVGIDFAKIALDLFEDAAGAVDAIERALGADADLEEYIQLVGWADTLARAEGADEAIARAVALVDKPYSNVGVPALRLFGAIAKARGDAAAAARFVLLAAERESDDEALLREADMVARVLGQTPSTERFEKKVPAKKRAAAWRTLADAERAKGHYERVLEALERCKVLAPAEEQLALEAEIREVYTLAGRVEDLEVRARHEAERDDAAESARADHWAEVAHLREQRGDVSGALQALLEAARLDAGPLERWSALERIAALAGASEARVRALFEIERRVDDEARPAVLRRLAHAQEEAGDLAAVEATWHRVLALKPDDEEADRAIESSLAQSSNFEGLADHLSRRADRLRGAPDSRDTLRVVRLRRAAILEQRLGKAAMACEELERLVAEWPNNESALRYLADLYERSGRPARAVPFWKRLAALSSTEAARAELMVRAATAAKASGDAENAQALAEEATGAPTARQAALGLVVQIARERHDDATLLRSLVALADASVDEPVRASDWLIEAAQAAARLGDAMAALDHARRAAAIAPTRASAQLFARGLEYRLRGAGNHEDATQTLVELGRVEGPLDVDDAALHAFLRAEALDIVQGGDAGLVELEGARTRWGAHALIEVGIAERYARAYRWEDSLGHFERAVAGQLLGLRSPAAVAMLAAEAAERAQRPSIALAFLELAAQDLGRREQAQKRIAYVSAQTGDIARARLVLEELAKSATIDDRPALLAQLARVLYGSAHQDDREEAPAILKSAIDAAAEGTVLRAQLEAELVAMTKKASAPPVEHEDEEPVALVVPRSVPRPPEPAGPVTASPAARAESASAPPEPRPAPNALAPPASPARTVVAQPLPRSAPPSAPPVASPRASAAPTPRPAELIAPESAPKTVAVNPRERFEQAKTLLAQGDLEHAELMLVECLTAGLVEAGDALATLLEKDRARAPDLVRVRRLQVDFRPGDRRLLEALRKAALTDHNPTFARAVDHVLRSFDPAAGPLPPPPLGAQVEQPGILQLLARATGDPLGDALALVWDASGAGLARDLASYGVSGTDRVSAGPATTLSRLYEQTLRLLAYSFPLYARRAPERGGSRASLASIPSAGPPRGTTMLCQPLAALLSGDTREDSPALRYALGYAFAASLPRNALLLGTSENDAKGLWSGVVAAFGPTESGRVQDPSTSRLVETFWTTMPARTQRRISEALASADTSFAPLLERARQTARRVGMFLAGDFETAARTALAEHGVSQDAIDRASLEDICARPVVADLLRLAVRPEYADARFRPVPEGPSRPSLSGRFAV